MNWNAERISRLVGAPDAARDLLSAMHAGVIVQDVQGEIVGANPAACAILGEDEARFTRLGALFDSEGNRLGPDYSPLKVTLSTGLELHRVLVGFDRPDGRRWLRVSTRLLHPNGVMSGVVCTFDDVTEERAVEAQLAETRSQYAELVAGLPGVLFQYLQRPDGTGEVLALSQEAYQIVGAEHGLLTGDSTRLRQLLRTDRAEIEARAEAAIQSGSVLEMDVAVGPTPERRANEPLRSIRFRARASRTESGVVWTGIALDVTDQLRLAEQVRHAQRREVIGDLSSGLAHNFNNLLAVVVPALDLVLPSLDEGGREVLQRAPHAVTVAADLVRRLVQVARPPAPQLEGRSDASAAVREVAELCARSFPSSVSVVCQGDAEPAYVRLGSTDLHQLLLNLAMNARDAVMARGGGRVTLRCEAGTDVTLSVHDDGLGVAPALVSRLGEPFLTTKPPASGSGLGLAAVYAIVREAGGAVRYEFDGGARFVVTLPRVVDAEPRPERPKPPADPSTGRILLAEDEPLVRHVLTLVLRRAGHDVVVATDGYEAERALSEDRFDLAILDISMPGPSGLDLLHRFKTAAQPMRIALLSGFVPDSAVTADADAVIWKPVNPEDLRKSVRDLLAMR